jgi:deubiquitinase DESI2
MLSFYRWLLILNEAYLYLTVHSVEHTFGAHDYPTSLGPVSIRDFMECKGARFNGDMYHLIAKNCCHICKDICYKMTGKSISTWVNRFARLGIFAHLVLFR